MGSLTSRAHTCLFPALTATAVFPAPRSIEARFDPSSAHGESRNESEETYGKVERRSDGARRARTVGIGAPVQGVALPKLPFAVVAPALDGRVVLR